MENRTTVLYVDDNPKSSRLLTSVLEECGFRVITKNDPVEALALCKRTYFDLALLDYEMPLMSGSQLAREIKFLVPDVPVVLISGRAALPATELTFVDAHFGFGTALDNLLWTMRILVRPKVAQAFAEAIKRRGRSARDDAVGRLHLRAAGPSARPIQARWSESGDASFLISYADCFIHLGKEDLSIADLSGGRVLDDGVDRGIDEFIF